MSNRNVAKALRAQTATKYSALFVGPLHSKWPLFGKKWMIQQENRLATHVFTKIDICKKDVYSLEIGAKADTLHLGKEWKLV